MQCPRTVSLSCLTTALPIAAAPHSPTKTATTTTTLTAATSALVTTTERQCQQSAAGGLTGIRTTDLKTSLLAASPCCFITTAAADTDTVLSQPPPPLRLPFTSPASTAGVFYAPLSLPHSCFLVCTKRDTFHKLLTPQYPILHRVKSVSFGGTGTVFSSSSSPASTDPFLNQLVCFSLLSATHHTSVSPSASQAWLLLTHTMGKSVK